MFCKILCAAEKKSLFYDSLSIKRALTEDDKIILLSNTVTMQWSPSCHCFCVSECVRVCM